MEKGTIMQCQKLGGQALDRVKQVRQWLPDDVFMTEQFPVSLQENLRNAEKLLDEISLELFKLGRDFKA